MAIDKSRTSNGMKIGVIILVVAFVLGIGGTLTTLTTATDTSQQTNPTAATGGLEQISQTALAGIAPAEEALKTKPNDYTLLKSLGDQYFDYALKVQQASTSGAISVTIWQRAADYYGRALAVTPGDPNVATDMAISQYYGNDAKGAVATIEPVLSKNATFAPAPYNAGIFYQALGENAKAKAAYETYLKLEPNGENSANAKKFLAEVSKTAQTAPASAPATK